MNDLNNISQDEESNYLCESVDSVDHIAIAVNNIAESVDWYTKNFACKIKYQDSTWAYLRFKNINLALVLPSEHPTHIAFIRDDAVKYGELKTHRDGTRSCYINDPNNNSIEILEPYSAEDN